MELPHRHPIALIDSHNVLDDENIVATYTIQEDHPVLEGHFPHIKIWPGVYLIEGMLQCAGLHALHLAKDRISDAGHSGYVTFVTSVDRAKFRTPVFPEDQLILTAKLIKRRRDHIFYSCEVWKNDKVCASATIGLTAKKL